MKTTNKLEQQFCIKVDQATASQIEKLANYYQRKGGEFLRLILAPVLRDYWAQMQREQHQENKQAPTLARFKDQGEIMRTKKEYIVIFYDLDNDQEKGRTKASELMTYRQAQKYIDWAYKYGLFPNAYGMPTKVNKD